MTLETLQLLHRCLLGQQLNVNAPDFRQTAAAVSKALDELEAAIEATSPRPE